MTLGTLWRDSSTDRTGLISPIGLQMVDDLTGGDPIGSVVCALFVEDIPANGARSRCEPDAAPVES